MKRGILIIIKEGDTYTFKVKRPDGHFIDLDVNKISNPEKYLQYNDKECDYISKKSQVVVKLLDGTELYNAQSEQVEKPTTTKKPSISAKEMMYNAEKETTSEYVQDEISISEIRRKILPDALKLKETKLPADVRKLSFFQIDNYYIKLQKCARWIDEGDNKRKFYFYKNDAKPAKKDKSASGHEFFMQPNFSKISFNNICERQLKQAKAIFAQDGCFTNSFSIDWRLALGLGTESVYETSITLHHIYGIPYIPASAVKGVVRSWVITENFNQKPKNDGTTEFDLKEAEKRALQNPEFCDIFGCDSTSYYKEAREGNIIFFDAFPCSEPVIEVDIMNNHYDKWYSKGEAPADYYNPNPVLFLTVGNKDKAGADMKFQFVIGVKKGDEESLDLLATAKQWLSSALTQHGIGAKTAVGYGYMNQNL